MEPLEGQCEMHAIIKGRVQGVGFRATTRDQARELGLRGTVRNLADGTVEIRAQGTKSRLEELIKALKKEMGLSCIERVDVRYFSIQQPFQDFRIVF